MIRAISLFRRSRKVGAQHPPQAPAVPDVRVTAVEGDFDSLDVRGTRLCCDAESLAAAPEPSQHQDAGDGRCAGYRPQLRPPMLLLRILDDNQVTDEAFRVRRDVCVLGREEGDVVVGHDHLMSARHALIERRRVGDRFGWILRDLQSRNGVFVRAEFARLKAGDELLIGRRTFRFDEAGEAGRRPPRLVESPDSPGALVVTLEARETWVGSGRNLGAGRLAGDNLLAPQHARFYESGGHWCVQATRSRNGLWIRVAEVLLRHKCSFQLGEQRFQVLFP